MDWIKRIGIVVLGVSLTGGCGGGQKIGHLPNAPTPPPPVPAVKGIAIDQKLIGLARLELNKAIESKDPIVRANAIEAVQDTAGIEGKDPILAGLNDGSPLVRFSACMAVGRLAIPDAKPRLIDLAQDSDPHVRIGARFALHCLGDTHLSHDLEKTARDFDPHIRADTAMVLGLLGEQSALRILHVMLDDGDADVRLQVAEAMWRLGDEDGLTNLVAGSVSGYADDQILCVLALAVRHDNHVRDHISGRLTAQWPEVGLAAARALGELGSDEGYGVAALGAKSKDPRTMVMAALAFGAIGRSDAQPMLAPMLRSPEQPVRLAAATALLQLKPPPAR